jgi:hypothetical protein
MICTYTYKGRTFNSEAELDDFLLEKDRLLSEYGDIVFSVEPTTAQTKARTTLADAATKAKERKKIWDSERVTYTEDGAIFGYARPYQGVNEFLSGLRNSEGKLFFPEFISHNYWSRRYLD